MISSALLSVYNAKGNGNNISLTRTQTRTDSWRGARCTQ